MAFVNLKNREIQVKIVYYGPGRGGKTSNLEYIYKKFAKRINTEMVTVKTHGDRTLFFDFLPFDIGIINGYDVKIQLYTVPGQVKYNATRRLVLRGVDLAAYNKSIFRIPSVFQYNKIDLKEQGIPLLPPVTLERDLNSQLDIPSFPASALVGTNVVATLKKIISLTVASIKKDLI